MRKRNFARQHGQDGRQEFRADDNVAKLGRQGGREGPGTAHHRINSGSGGHLADQVRCPRRSDRAEGWWPCPGRSPLKKVRLLPFLALAPRREDDQDSVDEGAGAAEETPVPI